MSNHFHQKYFTLRTKEGYDQQVKAIEDDPDLAKVYGVKSNSCLNKLHYFHVIGGMPSDLAHDLFEGVLPIMLGKIRKI